MRDTFRALAGRDFRLYFSGQSISLIGTWVQQVAFSWIAYHLTGSAFMLGLIAFCGQVPTLLLSPLGGMVADHYNKRAVLIVIQFLQMTVAATLALLVWRDAVAPWHLVAASLAVGLTGAIELPVRLAFTPSIVHDARNLPNAIALNSVTFNAARLVGPAAAGFIMAAFGETVCFAINALSYVPTIYTLAAIHPDRGEPRGRTGPLRESIDYLRTFAPARWLLIIVLVASFCLAPYLTFMPVYAKDMMQGGPETLGMLMSASGLGALGAGIYLANRKSVVGLGDRIVGACFAAALASVAFAYNTVLWVALPLLVVTGSATIIIVTSCNIVLQSLVPDRLRGRVMAFYSMGFVGMMPLSSLLAGSAANMVGVRPVFVVAGAAFATIGFALKRRLLELRQEALPVLREKGLVPK